MVHLSISPNRRRSLPQLAHPCNHKTQYIAACQDPSRIPLLAEEIIPISPTSFRHVDLSALFVWASSQLDIADASAMDVTALGTFTMSDILYRIIAGHGMLSFGPSISSGRRTFTTNYSNLSFDLRQQPLCQASFTPKLFYSLLVLLSPYGCGTALRLNHQVNFL